MHVLVHRRITAALRPMKRAAIAWGAVLLAALADPAGLPARAETCFGEVEVLATFPAEPGFPEGIAVDAASGTVYVSGAAAPGTAGNEWPGKRERLSSR